MSLSSDLNKHIYVGNGVTKTFDYEFDVLTEDDLHIYLTNTINGTEVEITSNYSVSPSEGTFPSSNGIVTYPSIGTAISSDYKLTIIRTLEVLQPTVYPNNTALKPKVVERSFDRITMIAQQQQEQIDRTLQFAITVPDDFSRSLPAPVALKALRINSDATAFEYTTDPEIAANQAAASAAAALASENSSATSETNAATSAATIGGFLDYTATAKTLDIISKGPVRDIRTFDITPDGITDWRANGKLSTALQWASTNKIPLYFPAGYYKCAMDNYYSNVTCIFEEGAIFGGTIHVAINTSAGDPTVSRPSNVKFYGTVGSYERVGTYNCDDVYIERIHLYSDTTKRIGGGKTAGCHFYLDTRNLTIGEIVVEDVASEGSYALGIDGNTTYEPVNVRIGKVHIKDSEVHGLYICGTGHYIGDLRIDGYGKGTQSTALPMALQAESALLKGVWCNRLSYSHVANVVVNQANTTLTNAKDAIYCDDGNYSFGTINVLYASATGFIINAQVETPIVRADKIKVTLSVGTGVIVTRGSLFCPTIVSQYNTLEGLQTTAGGKVFTSSLTVDYNTTIGAEIGSSSVVNIDYLSASNNGNTTRQVILTGTVTSRIGAINIVGSVTSPNTTGGLQIANCNDITIDRVDTVRCGVAGGALAAVRIETSNRVVIGSGYIQAGAGQGLRLVTLSDCSFNGLTIDSHVDNISAASLTRVGFSNSRSINGTTSQTNIANGGVATFNCTNITL